MNCEDCGCRLEVVKTMVLDATTQRLRECRCGSRFLTTEVVTKRLAALPVTARQPPGNRSALSSSSGSSLSLLPSADQTQTPARVERVIETFPVVGNNGETWGLPEPIHAELVKAYPGVDALAEYAKIKFWANSNPTKRKTPRGMPAFLQRWFEKAQNRAGAAPRQVSAVPPWKQAERDEEARKREAANQEIRARREIQARLDAAGRNVG